MLEPNLRRHITEHTGLWEHNGHGTVTPILNTGLREGVGNREMFWKSLGVAWVLEVWP